MVLNLRVWIGLQVIAISMTYLLISVSAEAEKSNETGGGLVGWLAGFRIHRQLKLMLELLNFWMCKDDLYILFCFGVAENAGGS